MKNPKLTKLRDIYMLPEEVPRYSEKTNRRIDIYIYYQYSPPKIIIHWVDDETD